MGSETDSECSSSSSSEKERKRKKLKKKLKNKLDRKHKKLKKNRRNEKKYSRKESKEICNKDDNFKNSKLINNDVAVYGPALPQHLSNIHTETDRNQSLVIGPVMPTEFLKNLEPQTLSLSEINGCVEERRNENDNLQGFYGPLPVTNEFEMTSAQVELEQRALQLKMAAMDGINSSTSNTNVREEWMLELPDVGLKSGLAALNNLKRGFHQGKEKPDFSDRSIWTKTPNSGQHRDKPKSSKQDLLVRAQALREKYRDAEQEMIARKHKKKHKRGESLVELHQKKLYKEEKKKAKELKKSGLKPERRPFTRDVDLKLNKIDRNQTKQIVDKAKILNTKFSSGQSKYL